MFIAKIVAGADSAQPAIASEVQTLHVVTSSVLTEPRGPQACTLWVGISQNFQGNVGKQLWHEVAQEAGLVW